MKKILSILGTITLIGTSTTSLVACKPQYSEEQLKELKEENKISINGNTLEWMAPQEKPFKKSDDKWYFVIWRGNKNDDWRIAKFCNAEPKERWIKIDGLNNRDLFLLIIWNNRKLNDLRIYESKFMPFISDWTDTNSYTYFKAVYRWDGDGEPNTPIIDPKTGKIIDQKKDK